MFSLSIGVELLTPVFPQYFLLLASTANIAKQISLASYLATNVSIQLELFFFNKKFHVFELFSDKLDGVLLMLHCHKTFIETHFLYENFLGLMPC